MKQVWKTIDGEIFADALDAEKHENDIMASVEMWDKDGNRTTETDAAMVVHLVDSTSYDTFIALCKEQEGLVPTDKEMCSEDIGWWIWSCIAETYFPLDPDEMSLIAKVVCSKNCFAAKNMI